MFGPGLGFRSLLRCKIPSPVVSVRLEDIYLLFQDDSEPSFIPDDPSRRPASFYNLASDSTSSFEDIQSSGSESTKSVR